MNRTIIDTDSKQMFIGLHIPLWSPVGLEETFFFQKDVNKRALFKSYTEDNNSIILLQISDGRTI